MCEDVKAAAHLPTAEADVSAIAWSPRLGRSEERVAIARGRTVSVVAFQSGDGDGAGMGGEVDMDDALDAEQVCWLAPLSDSGLRLHTSGPARCMSGKVCVWQAFCR